MTNYEFSCADLPEMIRVLCLPNPPATSTGEREDMRWHISACPSCHEASAPLHNNEPPFCPKLRLLPLSLYRTERAIAPSEPEAQRLIAAMDLEEARAVVKHAEFDACSMCELWRSRLEKAGEAPIAWGELLAEELLASMVPAFGLASPWVVKRWISGAPLDVPSSAMSLGFDAGRVDPAALAAARAVLDESSSLALEAGAGPERARLAASTARLAPVLGRTVAEVRERILSAWQRAASRSY